MSANSKVANKHADVMVDTLQQTNQSLHRLVELGESLLSVLTVPGAVAGNGTPPTTAPRSVGCSAGSENSTRKGVFDLSQEDIISFAQASEMIPTHPSVSSISRWCSPGCRKIKLESFYIGGRRKTTKQAVGRFLLRCRNQGWAGMHASTVSYLERAMAEKELSHE